MAKTDYPIYTDGGKLFCKKVVEENEEQILQGPKGLLLKIDKLCEEI